MDSDSETESLLNSSENDEESSSSESESEDDSLDVARNWCRIDVSITPPAPAPPNFPFNGNPGLKVPVSDAEDPFEFFKLFFNDDIFAYIVQETNRFAAEFLEAKELTPSSRALQWKETTKNEMYKFVALMLLQGFVQKPVEKWFWTKRPALCTPFFQSVMPQSRYELLMKFLHFENSDNFNRGTHPNPKLRKIYDIQEKLVVNFKKIYVPDQYISIDESLMAYKGLLGWKQYNPKKKAKFGIKFYQLCEAETGYIWNSVIYTGKETLFMDKYQEYGCSTKSVMTLVDGLLGQGYCLTTDNFYTSPELAELLIAEKTDLVGTMRSNRKNLPKEIRTEKLKKGKIIAFQKGKMCALKWKDKKDICMLSTIHNATTESVTSTKTKKVKVKPSVVVDYNRHMGGIDKSDQCLSYYPVTRNQQRKYYKKIFRHLINQAVWNSFVIYKKQKCPLKHADFRLRLIERLIEESGPNDVALNRRNPVKASENVMRLTGRHFPSAVPDHGIKRKNPVRICKVCSLKTNENGKRIRRESRYECVECNVGLCVDPCFKIYHTVSEL